MMVSQSLSSREADIPHTRIRIRWQVQRLVSASVLEMSSLVTSHTTSTLVPLHDTQQTSRQASHISLDSPSDSQDKLWHPICLFLLSSESFDRTCSLLAILSSWLASEHHCRKEHL